MSADAAVRAGFVTAPDGRLFAGIHPDDLGPAGEGLYIASLARQLGGVTEVVLPAGRADVATDTDVFEVESIKSWRHGAQQAYAYGGMSGLRSNLALFGRGDYLPIYRRVRDHMPGLTLWILVGAIWTSVLTEATIPAPPSQPEPWSGPLAGPWLTVKVAATILAHLRIGEQAVRRLCDDGTLAAVRVGRRKDRRIVAASVHAFVAAIDGHRATPVDL